jgi:hypothetical protein
MQGKIFPTILIVLNLCASIEAGMLGNWRRMIYWLAAATLNITITF